MHYTLTVMRLGITGKLATTLCSTNPCESMIEIVRYTQRNVKSWQDGDGADSDAIRTTAMAVGQTANRRAIRPRTHGPQRSHRTAAAERIAHHASRDAARATVETLLPRRLAWWKDFGAWGGAGSVDDVFTRFAGSPGGKADAHPWSDGELRMNFGDQVGRCRAPTGCGEDAEAPPAVAVDRSAEAQRCTLHATRCGDDRLIASEVALLAVNLLEAFDLHDRDGEADVLGSGQSRRGLSGFVKGAVAGQQGERVARR
jgi:hypothetical protein